MKKISIKGKPYVEVHERVSYFRKNFGTKEEMFGINTQIEEWDKENKEVITRAWITDPNGRTVASGLAHESQGDPNSFVNATSYVENCETSAIGRALAAMGIGIEDAYASADEVNRAIEQREVKQQAKSQDRNIELTEMMNDEQKKTNDPYLLQYKTSLANVFVEMDWKGSEKDQRDELIKNILAEDNTDMIEYDIQDFANANKDNKEKLKKYCEEHIAVWKNTLSFEDYEELGVFMNYLNKKFTEEVA